MKILVQKIIFLLIPILVNAQITYEPAFPNLEFEFPVEIQPSIDGTDRMFVVEQSGLIKVFPRDVNALPGDVTTFLDIRDRVRFISGQEVGLLGLAFHPDYANNRYLYVYYTANSDVPDVNVKMVLSRFRVRSGNPNLVNLGSEQILFQFDKNQRNSNHNGGKIAFGPDGYLYISFGDGGGGNDPNNNAQNTNNVFGSICRIDVDLDGNNPVETNPDEPNGNYEIPSDNPFVGIAGSLEEIYAYGIRNTWKFSFDTLTGTLWGADVGQVAFEEINIIENGKNYGWKRFEGYQVSNGDTPIAEPTEFPIFTYERVLEEDRSITGGYVYRGSEITSLSPDISSKYIFGDFVSGRVWALDYNPTTGSASSTFLFKTDGLAISSFGLDENGELYFSDYGTNAQLYKLVDGTTTTSAIAVEGIGAWANLQEGINGIVQAVETDSAGNVYFGGAFNTAGNITANNIAMWNETNGWQSLGDFNGSISTLKIAPNGNLYAGGSFTEINSTPINNIAVWDGNTWSPLDSGINGTVAVLEIDASNNVYAGGTFETLNGDTVRNIAFWNGANWSALTDATNAISGTNNEIRSLALDADNILYVGGNFDEAGGNTANRIATWDGTNWGTLGIGTSGFVEAIATSPSHIYVGGNFATAGGNTVNRIARWNKTSSTWEALGNGLSNIVNSLLFDGTNLYAAGAFDNSNLDETNSIIVNNITRWNETNGWEALGRSTNVGVDIKINAMAFAKDANGVDNIFAGGNFNNAGEINTSNVAQWFSDNLLSIDVNKHGKTVYVYPNPTKGDITLNSKHKWVLYNSLGKIIKKGESKKLSFLNYSPGLYFLKTDEGHTIKILKN